MPRVISHLVTLDCREALIRRWQRTGDLTARLEAYDNFSDVYAGRLWDIHPSTAPSCSVTIDASLPRVDDLIILSVPVNGSTPSLPS